MEEAVIKRIMPNNPEAEEAVIGSMLLDEEIGRASCRERV